MPCGRRICRGAWIVPSLLLFALAAGQVPAGASRDDGTTVAPPSLESTPPVPLDLVFEEPPFDLGGIEALYARDVAYGPYEDNVFDIFLVSSQQPTGLVVFIHGGGFTTGDKGVAYLPGGHRNDVRSFLAKGYSYATINYRLLEEVDHEGVIKPLTDSRRCLQTLRYHHQQLNIDPTLVVLYGSSAGAGTSLWLAFSDEMADPLAEDPVLRQSTRVVGVGANGTQSTYDLLKWETVVFASLGVTLEDLASLPDSSEQGLLSFYGASSLEELGTPELQAYRARVDMLGLMSLDDPPFYVNNTLEVSGVPTDKNEAFHHPLHAAALKDQAALVGLRCVAYAPPLGIEDPSGQGIVDFLSEQLESARDARRPRARRRVRGH